MRSFGPAPSAAEIEALARAALAALPEPFAGKLVGVVLQVEEFADEDVLAELGIEDPFDLTGLYSGRPLTEKSVSDSGALPDRIFLYRRPLLDEWAAEGETLEDLVTHVLIHEGLVTHVLIHEAGHHFGFSDADMHALEDEAP